MIFCYLFDNYLTCKLYADDGKLYTVVRFPNDHLI